MKNIFNKVRVNRPKMSKFDLTHTRKMSIQMGKLYPCFVQEVLPGDRFRVGAESMTRFAPMLAPVMHEVKSYIHYFFVPNRLIWDEWETFITGGPEGTDVPVRPYIPVTTANAADGTIFGESTLWDYLGLPSIAAGTVINDQVQISSLPFRAYQKIYNDWYRDQNLEAELAIPTTSGSDQASLTVLKQIRNRAWEKDYFTSALPFAQRGAAVEVPVTGIGEATYLPQSNIFLESGMAPGTLENVTTGSLAEPTGLQADGDNVRIENIDEISITSANFTINMLRYAVRLQEWLEKNALGGARYVEQILAHFGVVSPDARIQRPEYLGGGITPVRFSEVLSTADVADPGIPQGNMAGHGIAFGTSNGFNRRFVEHGYVIGIMSVLPRTAYQQGIPRHFLRPTKLDYAWPEFAHLGEQEVMSGEIYYDPASPDGYATTIPFGYQSRFADYKYQPSTVHGVFRSSYNYWHMGRIFPSLPSLNQQFVQSDPTDRIFSVIDPEVENLYVQVLNKVSAIRPLPYFGTPSL